MSALGPTSGSQPGGPPLGTGATGSFGFEVQWSLIAGLGDIETTLKGHTQNLTGTRTMGKRVIS